EREPFGGDGRETEAHALGDVFRRLHVERFHVDDATRHLAVHADLLPHLDLGHLAIGVLEHELIAATVEEMGEHPPVRALAAWAREQIAEADVIADLGLHALDARVEHLDVLTDLARHDSGRGLVDLYPGGTGRGERPKLRVDGRHQIPAEREAVAVVRVAGPRLHVNGQGHRPRAGRLHGLVGLGHEVVELVDGAEPLRYADLPDWAIPRDTVVGVEAGLSERLERLGARPPSLERLHEERGPPPPRSGDGGDPRPL